MRYFGIGLSRTGTKSLYSAFMMLGYIPVVHYPNPKDWSNIDSYQFANDLPIPARFEELDDRFPDARFIYTTRDMDSWLDSCKRHWGKMNNLVIRPQWMNEYRLEMYGVDDFNADAFRKAYIRHDEHVRDYFGSRDDFLVMNIVGGQGWERLLPFLDLGMTKFPHHR